MENHAFYKISNTIYQALLCNISFSLSNLPLFLFILFFSASDGVFWLTILLLLTLLPSISSLIYCIHQLSLLESKPLIPMYFSFFKKIFFKTLPYSFLMGVISFNMLYSHFFRSLLSQMLILIIAITGLIVLGILVTFAYFLAFNPMEKTLSIFSYSFYHSLRKWYLTLLTIGVFVAFFMSLFLIPILGFLVIPVFFGGFIYLICRGLTGSLKADVARDEK